MNNKNIIGDINITSLADVSITLLVIFIITAPMMTPGIDVSLPRTDASLPHDEQGITVTIKKNGELYLESDLIALVRFEDELRKALGAKPPGVIVYLRSDEKVEYGYVVQIIGHMRKAGVKEIGLVAEILAE